MNSRRPSKPNLPNVTKPSKLLLQWGYAEPIFSLAYQIPLLDHSINQYEIGPFFTASQTPNGLLTDMGIMRKDFGNIPLKDLTMERKRVEEFEESLCVDCGWLNLVFLWGFSLNILSKHSIYFMGMRGIYTCVCLECEESVFPKQSWLVAWLRGLN